MTKTSRPGSIQKRILTITISCLVGMCIIISSVSFYLFRNYLQRSLIQSTETNLQLISDSINGSMNDIYQMVRFCCTNRDIATYIENNPNPGSVMSVATYDRITEEYTNNTSKDFMTRLAIVTGENFLQIVSAEHSSTADLAKEVPSLTFFSVLLNAPDYDFSMGFIKDPFSRNGKMVLPIIRPITYKFNSVQGGCLFIEVADDLFISALNRYTIAEDSYVYLTIGEHNYIYEDGTLKEFLQSYKVTDDLTESAMIEGIRITEIKNNEGITKIMVTAPLDMPGCYISQSISHLELRHQQFLLWFLLIGTIASISAFGIFLMLTMNKMINVPVAKIRAKMVRVAEGDFDRDPSIEWEHELGEIGKGINDLSENVLTLMQTRVENEKQKNDLEYKMLQSQINPHFIYNTLNSIKWMATIQGADGISEMTTALAKLLKSISKGTSLLVPIQEEFALIQDYFTIQSYRYGGTVSMEVKVDDDAILEYPILKFTLQPLVENAIFHGIEPKGSGNILIHASFEANGTPDDGICIKVTDNGVGMSPEKAKDILQTNNDSSADFFREIGVSNVHKRLQYEFGEQYGITIESVEGAYTTMAIHIPATKE